MEHLAELFPMIAGLFTRRIIVLISSATLLLAVVSAVLVPIALAELPEDYLLRDLDPLRTHFARANAPGKLALAGRNLAGLVLVVLGLVMLLVPGQGVLTVLVGLALLDFPGKRGLERRLLARESVRRAVDWMRRKRGRPPLKIPGELPSPEEPGAG